MRGVYMDIKEIQIATNETIMELMKHQKEQCKQIRNMFMTVIISFTIMIGMCVGGIMYFINTFEIETFTETTTTTTQTVEGDSAEINNVQGDQFKDGLQE